jgi:hypothetical protein
MLTQFNSLDILNKSLIEIKKLFQPYVENHKN